jgi:hypothetical protein
MLAVEGGWKRIESLLLGLGRYWGDRVGEDGCGGEGGEEGEVW